MEHWKAEVRSLVLDAEIDFAYKPMFHCDYTTRTCVVGYTDSRYVAVFVRLAEDRKTVLGHFDCRGEMCLEVESGRVFVHGEQWNTSKDRDWYGYPLD
jgi:hypothetical protein